MGKKRQWVKMEGNGVRDHSSKEQQETVRCDPEQASNTSEAGLDKGFSGAMDVADGEDGSTEMPTRQELGILLGQEMQPGGDDQMLHISEEECLIRALRHRLRFWDIVYGDQLPPANDQLAFTWFRGPVPKSIKQLNTQGHLPTTKVNINGIICETEDPHFGLFVPEDSEKMTETEKMTEKQKDAYKKSCIITTCETHDQGKVTHLDCSQYGTAFSCGWRETWKEIAEKKGLREEDAKPASLDACA